MRQLDPACLDPHLQSIAVELYLVNPALARRRLWRKCRERWLDKSREGRAFLAPLILEGSGTFAAWVSEDRASGSFGRRLCHWRFFLSILPVFDDQPGSSPATSAISRPVFTEFRALFKNIRIAFSTRRIIFRLYEQPVLALFARLAMHANQMPAALKAFRREVRTPDGPWHNRTSGQRPGSRCHGPRR